VGVLDAAGPARGAPPEKALGARFTLALSDRWPAGSESGRPTAARPSGAPSTPRRLWRDPTDGTGIPRLPRGRPLSSVRVGCHTAVARRSRASARSAAGALPPSGTADRWPHPPSVTQAPAGGRARRARPAALAPARARAAPVARRGGSRDRPGGPVCVLEGEATRRGIASCAAASPSAATRLAPVLVLEERRVSMNPAGRTRPGGGHGNVPADATHRLARRGRIPEIGRRQVDHPAVDNCGDGRDLPPARPLGPPARLIGRPAAQGTGGHQSEPGSAQAAPLPNRPRGGGGGLESTHAPPDAPACAPWARVAHASAPPPGAGSSTGGHVGRPQGGCAARRAAARPAAAGARCAAPRGGPRHGAGRGGAARLRGGGPVLERPAGGRADAPPPPT